MLHAIFLGFVISMIFAHAPVIVPAVLGRPCLSAARSTCRWRCCTPTLLLRLVGGDAVGNMDAWQWGGSLNEVALLLFIALAATAVIRARKVPRPAPKR